MADVGADSGLGVFGQFAARLQERRKRAEEAGDAPAMARYDAMQAVLRTKLVPLVCPEALTLAGEAATAACEGLREGQWLQKRCRECDRLGESRVALYKAIRLLKTVGIWPWEAGTGVGIVRDGHDLPAATPAAHVEGDPQDTALSLEV